MKVDTNYHTHTYYCRHATGLVSDYCEAALKREMHTLGISDHTPYPDGRWSHERMFYTQLQDYSQEIERAQEEYSELRVLKALECEYCPDLNSYYSDELLGTIALDYLIGSVHYIPFHGDWISVYHDTLNEKSLYLYAKHFIRSMESGFFRFMAHPDLFGIKYIEWDAAAESCARDILEASAVLGIPLEVNGSGFRKEKIKTSQGIRNSFPVERFWQIAAEYDISVVTNSDAHRPEDVDANISDSVAIAEKNKLKFAELIFD